MSRTTLLLVMAGCAALVACEPDRVQGPIAPEADVIAPPAAAVTVMTRNLYLGFEIDQLIAGNMGLPQALAALAATNYPERAEVLADEIVAARPDLVGLQEVIDYRIQYPSDFMQNFLRNATTPYIPFLDLLLAALAERGVQYDVVVKNPTTDMEIPVPAPAPMVGYMDMRYTDHDVILARSDVELGAVTSQIFADRITFNLGGIPGTRPLGFAAVEAVVNGAPLLFVTSHLETQFYPAIQEAQTAELLEWLEDAQLPVVLVGDYNSAANPGAPATAYTATYGMLLAAGFQDLWVKGNRQNNGVTCCHTPDLRGFGPLDQRLDLIMLRADAPLVGGYTAKIVGDNPSHLTESGMWPSDHAGVIATFRLPLR